MKTKHILIAIGLFLIPIVARTFWYYHGVYTPGENLQTPDFLELEIATPELSTSVVTTKDKAESSGAVLFDLAHANQYQITEIEVLIDDLKNQGVEIITLDENEDLNMLLKGASAFVSIAPTMNFTEEEVQTVQNFVERGGRLLVITDPTRSTSEYVSSRSESVQVANTLLEPYQLTFRDDYAYNVYAHEGNFRNIILHPRVKSDLTANVSELVFYSTRSLSSYETNLIAGDENTLSSLTDSGGDLCLAALSGENVLAIGDFTFLTSPYYQVSDNAQFVTNISNFLLSSDRQKTFADFPYLFSQSIGILPDEGITIDQDLLDQIGELKDLYRQKDLSVEILEEDDEDFDLILLGLLPANETVMEYLEGFDIQFGSQPRSTAVPQVAPVETEEELDEETIEPTATSTPAPTQPVLQYGQVSIGGIGQVAQDDFGFILLKSEDDRTILILLSDNQDGLINLLAMLSYGDLDSCYIEGDIALCEQNNYGWNPSPTPYVELEELLEATPIPTGESD